MLNPLCPTSITSRFTNIGRGVMPYIEHTWGDTNIWEAYFRCENCLNKSDIFMSPVTFCSAWISMMEVTSHIMNSDVI